jgi:hypothetical protein
MQNDIEYKYCLNCNSELHGKYCHVCGQQATSAKPTVKEFLMEYLNIAFIWDAHFLKTFWKLITRPGYLTNQYVSGKFVAYTHPLKLNMFLLFIFISLFLFFHSTKDLNSTVHKVTRDERLLPAVQIDLLIRDQAYLDKLKASPKDTVQLYAPFFISESYSEVITDFDNNNSNAGDSVGVWTAVVPHLMIEDKVLEVQPEGYYTFSDEQTAYEGIRLLETIYAQMVSLITRYFPLVILLTAPFLALLLHLINRKGKHSRFKHFIFVLHYTAMLELLVIAIYILFLIAEPSTSVMEGILTLCSLLYLTFAVRSVYETKNWFIAFIQAMTINFGYLMILMMFFIVIFIISLILVGLSL